MASAVSRQVLGMAMLVVRRAGRPGSGRGGSELTDARQSLRPSRRCSGCATNWPRRRRANSVASIMCDMGRMRAIAIAATCCVLVAACSSAEHSAVPGPVPGSASSSSDAVQKYLNAVNGLCDGLEQKIIALNGGQFDIPLKDFLAQLPRHTELRDDFDRRLAAIVVPPAATAKARALADYIAFANKLDAARLRASRRGCCRVSARDRRREEVRGKRPVHRCPGRRRIQRIVHRALIRADFAGDMRSD